MAASDQDPEPISPMWMAHHFPEDYHRCTVIGRRNVCRRCSVLWPICFVVMVLSLALATPTNPTDPWLLLIAPLPAVIDFVAEHLDLARYSPRRQVVVTVPLAIALGRGLAIYLERPGSPLFWGVVLGYGAICVSAALVGNRRRNRSV